jgi:hypothetical protein
MKNASGSIDSVQIFDFAAIRIFVSIIAISFAMIASGALPSDLKVSLHKPVLSTAAKELQVCPIPASHEVYGEPKNRVKTCHSSPKQSYENDNHQNLEPSCGVCPT